LHPTDFSKQSEFAFQLACSLARDYGAELHIVHVITPPIVAYGEGVLPVAPENLEEELRQNLNQLRPDDATVRVVHHLWEGEPVDQILHLAKESGCDLIVMGTHGRTGLGRVLMGSVAEGVVRRAPCPVLTIKNPLPEARPAAEASGQVGGKVSQTVEARCAARSRIEDL
jgi:nucleotide-binding universal stress UspA family protein